MKLHRFIYMLPFHNNKTLFFNGTTSRFFIVNSNKANIYSSILSAPEKYLDVIEEENVNILKEGGFWIENNTDEISEIKKKRERYSNRPIYKTAIVSTYDCNYRCWYCTQKHEKAVLSKEKLELIKKHVTTYLKENDIKVYVLSWFGGEPLMEPQTIEDLSSYLLQYCKEHGVRFVGSITTNAALLMHETIEMLKRVGVNHYQITIDGSSRTHDKIKYDDIHESTFRLTLGNIVDLLQTNLQACVTLRINYTPKTLTDDELLPELNAAIPQELRHRIKIDLQKVWQIDEERISMDALIGLQHGLAESGYKFFTEGVFAPCYVDMKHYNMLYYNGKVGKCGNNSLSELRGHLDEDGRIVWEERPEFMDIDILAENSPCRDCQYFPLCNGGCPARRTKAMLDRSKCRLAESDTLFEHRILDYCWRVIHNEHITV